jgi:hypothetical protein
MEAANLLNTLAFLGFLVGYVLVLRGRSTAVAHNDRDYHMELVLPFILIGIIGFAATFGTALGTLFVPVTRHPVVAPVRGFIGAIFRPFAAFALIVFWAKRIEQLASARRRLKAGLLTALFGIGIVTIFATYGLGRNIFMVPLLSMIAAYGLRVRRLSVAALVALATLLAAISVVAGSYRTVAKTDEVNLAQANPQQQLTKAMQVSNNIQVYGDAPQFLAFVIEQSHWGHTLWWGSTLIPSIMYPVPELGKAFRESSGAAIYNRWLYGGLPVRDQNLPVQGELFMNFHLPGVVLGFCLLGILIALLHRRFMNCGSALSGYVLQFAAIWAAFLIEGDSTSVAYIAVTFSWPMLLYAGYDRLSRKSARSAGNPRHGFREAALPRGLSSHSIASGPGFSPRTASEL